MRVQRGQPPPDFDEDPQVNAIKAEVDRVVRRNQQLETEIEEQRWDIQPDTVLPFSECPKLLVQVQMWGTVGRILPFGFIEKFGTAAPAFGIGADVLFALLSLWVLSSWVKAEWHANSWLVVPRGILVLISLAITANMLTLGAVWEGKLAPTVEAATDQPDDQQQAAPDTQQDQAPADDTPLWLPAAESSAFSVLFLLLAASSYCAFCIYYTQKFLDHPVRMFRKGKEHFHDKG